MKIISLIILFSVLSGQTIELTLTEGLVINIYEPFYFSGDTLFANIEKPQYFPLREQYTIEPRDEVDRWDRVIFHKLRGFELSNITRIRVIEIEQKNSYNFLGLFAGGVLGGIISFPGEETQFAEEKNMRIIVMSAIGAIVGYFIGDSYSSKYEKTKISEYNFSKMQTAEKIELIKSYRTHSRTSILQQTENRKKWDDY